jgi:hypothetical protein
LLLYSEHVAEFGTREFAKAQRAHEEGVIAKLAAGLYYSGKRTREWLKFKAVHEQEVVIVGYTEPRRSRKYFGSLVLAVRDNATKRWVYAGHVGTGFDQAALKSLYGTMQPLRADKKPFDQKVKDENATTWLIPKLVGEVKFTEWKQYHYAKARRWKVMRGARPGTMARTLTSPDGDRQPSCSPRTGRARTAANLAKLPQAATEALRLTHHGLPQALVAHGSAFCSRSDAMVGTAHEPGVARDTRLRQRTFVSGRRETQCVNPLIADMSGPCWDFHLIGVFSLDLGTSGWSTARCTDARAASANLHCNIRTGSTWDCR